MILPCGDSICRNHLTQDSHKTLTKHHSSTTDEIDCGRCSTSHVIPSSGFIPNKSLEQIIRTQIDELDLGSEYNEATLACHTLGVDLDAFDVLERDPLLHVKDTIRELAYKVELKREELKMRVDEEAASLTNALAGYESECDAYLRTLEYHMRRKQAHTLVESVRVKLAEWTRELDKVKRNESRWRRIKERCEQASGQVRTCVRQVKEEVLLGKIDEFEWKTSEFLNVNFKTIDRYL